MPCPQTTGCFFVPRLVDSDPGAQEKNFWLSKGIE